MSDVEVEALFILALGVEMDQLSHFVL